MGGTNHHHHRLIYAVDPNRLGTEPPEHQPTALPVLAGPVGPQDGYTTLGSDGAVDLPLLVVVPGADVEYLLVEVVRIPGAAG